MGAGNRCFIHFIGLILIVSRCMGAALYENSVFVKHID